MFVDTGDCDWKDIKLSILNVAVGEGTFQVGLFLMKMSWEHFFFLLNGDERERESLAEPDYLFFFRNREL